MKPNLFKFGTGELTHDAILSWCLYWGNYKTSPLYDLSKDFIELLTGYRIEIEKIEIFPEKYHMDILAIVNNKIVIIIEDKIDTYARTGQLERYKKVTEEKYGDKKRFYSYVTVGDEPNYENILNQDYSVVKRKDLLSLVNKYKKHSEILKDYSEYLSEIEKSYTSYKKEDLNKWTYRGWQGFFEEELKGKFKDGSWRPVSNARAGFQAFYWDFMKCNYQGKTPYTIYLQIEGFNRNRLKDKIAFKVRVDDKTYRSEIRNYLYNKLINIVEEGSLIDKPKRFGHGLTMTYAEINKFETKEDLYHALELVVNTQKQLHKSLRSD